MLNRADLVYLTSAVEYGPYWSSPITQVRTRVAADNFESKYYSFDPL